MISPFQIKLAARLVNQGGIIAYPTESVYGLGCDPLDEVAVNDLCRIKQRPLDKGLILITDELEKLAPLVSLNEAEKKRILEHQEIVTWLVNKSAATPPWISGRHPKIAIRISRHPLALALCRELPMPLVSTSANVSQRPPIKNCVQVHQQFGHVLDKILCGLCGPLERPTPIIDIHSGKVLRS